MRTRVVAAVALSSFLLLGLSCGSRSGGGEAEQRASETTPPQPADAESLESIADLCRDPSRFGDRTLRLVGVFQGFRVAACRFPPAARAVGTTRSDWLLRTGDDCAYVTGGAPPGIDLIDLAHLGRKVEVEVRVVRHGDGKILLQYVGGRVLPE